MILPLTSKDLKDLAFVIHGTPKVARLATNPGERLIQMPSPLRIASLLVNAPLPDLRSDHWTEPIFKGGAGEDAALTDGNLTDHTIT